VYTLARTQGRFWIVTVAHDEFEKLQAARQTSWP